ncbi:MAG: two-component system sensor histidine kinase NtrB, partial [Myxococcales bacterium]
VVAASLLAFGTYLVISSRRSAALRERLKHADRLAHLHEKTQKILDNIPTGVVALSVDGRISAVNAVLQARVPGLSPGARLAELFARAPPSLTSRVEALVETATRSGKVQSLRGETVPLFGEEGQYTVHVVPLEPRDPEVRTLLVVEDLSDLRALESQLLRAEKLATVGVLAAGIAHEVGTPLGVVRGRAEYIKGKLGEGHPQGAGMQVIIEQIDRISRTIRQLLDFSRLQPAAARRVPLQQSARTVHELLRFELERRKVELSVDVPERLAPLAADPDQLQQVLINLVLNAADACAPGGRVRIAAQPERPGEEWGRTCITVSDDGCGIPEQNLHQVFDPFFTTKKRGQGTGLGLAVVAQVVRNHGGQVEIESESGKGTRVTLLWPVAEANEVRNVV